MQSRREFLKRLAASAVVLALDPYRGVSIKSDLYTNDRMGVSFVKPSTWEYSSIADFAALRERQVLKQLFESEPHPLKDPTNLPVVILEDDLNRSGPFAPSIGLFDEILDGDTPSDQSAAHLRMLDGFSISYHEVIIHESPRRIEFNNERGTLSTWSYKHEIDDGTKIMLKVRSLVIFKEPRVHTFHLTDTLDSPIVRNEVWDEFINTIRYN